MSLRWRILWALILSTLLTVTLSLGMGYSIAKGQFDALVDELGRSESTNLARRLSEAYTEAGGWQTLDIALDEAGYLYDDDSARAGHGEASNDEADEPFHIDRLRIIIVDEDNHVILDNFAELTAGQRAADLSGHRADIVDTETGQTVAQAYVDVHQIFLAAESSHFLRELLVGFTTVGILIAGAALLLATSLAKRIIAPVSALTRATQALALRDESTLLPVTSDDELGRMSAAFNALTSALQRQRDLRRRLINDISHELNSPLTVIQLEAQGLRDSLQSPDRAATHIIQEVTMLRNLVSDLNWLAETDSGETQMRFERLALGPLLTSEVERWQPQAQARQIRLIINPLPNLPSLNLDSMRMRQALGNILHNAIQHSENGQARVSVSMADGHAVITVSDDGAGIDEADLPRVTRRYYQASQSQNRGAGLGLDIARAIIEAHDGSIAVHSDGLGHGTTVECRLPITPQVE